MKITLVTNPPDDRYRGLMITVAGHDYTSTTSTTGNFAVDLYGVALFVQNHDGTPEQVVRALAEAFEITTL